MHPGARLLEPERLSSKAIRIRSDRIALRTSEGVHLLTFREIVRCQAESNYCWVYMADGRKLLLAKTLGAVQQKLPQRMFVRVHSGHVVNINFVRWVGKHGIRLQDDAEVPVSRHRKKDLMAYLQNYYWL